jgi:tetratricopeptide (TPR) repeat protein
MKSNTVRVWSERVSLPTWEIGDPNPNPMFLEKRVYQGSSGAVYPYPVIDKIADESTEREWTAVFLENEILELMILPELGGRLHRAVDKTNGYRLVYHNQVIKPALVGLTGPWISGGIEFNWPQHHRPSTYSPVDWTLEEGEDGSCIVWCAENERMFRQRGRHGFRLEPGRASFDVVVRLSNPCEQSGTFLWWANPAVHVHDDYQSVFPTDVHAVMDHGKRDVSSFPTATGVYYKHDYSPGTDISRYKSIPVPTSYMAYHSDYNHVGCYDHAAGAGMLHVANHHFVPGKKQWTWGNGEFGRAWDRQLTEENGPYIELMCGAFTDNQPDFTWLSPGEEKRFVQTFLSYKDIGPAHTASRDWVLRLEPLDDGRVTLGVYAVADGRAKLELWHTPTVPPTRHNAKNMHLPALDRPIDATARKGLERELDLKAGESWTDALELPAGFRASELTLRLLSEERKILLSYSLPPVEKPEVPVPATPAPKPEQVISNEELWLHGRHLEQYRHATYRPEPYYEEALRRDSGDSRCHTALGRLLLMRGEFAEAEAHFRQAIDRLTLRNPNPADGEAYYQLGLGLRYQQRWEEAEDAFYKAAWTEAWKSPAFFELTRLACRRQDWEDALDLINESLHRNGRHAQAGHLRIRILKKLGRGAEVKSRIRAALKEDPLDFRASAEAGEALTPHQALLLGLDLLHAGFFEEAVRRFEQAVAGEFLAGYFRGWALQLAGDLQAAKAAFTMAGQQSLAFAFPNVLETVPALETALEMCPNDALAAYALGNFLYAHRRPESAIDLWERCTEIRPDFPTAWRNLGLARMNQHSDAQGAAEALTRSFDADPSDARVLYEGDQLAKETAASPESRLARLDACRALCLSRDDLCVEYLNLLNGAGHHADALSILAQRVFHPWEGGEGKVPAAYVRACIGRAIEAEKAGKLDEAKGVLERAGMWPENLGEGKLAAHTENERWWRLGRVLRQLGDVAADDCLERATRGDAEPAGAMYYNDQPPENVYFQGLALRDLGREKEACSRFESLRSYAATHRNDEVKIDYFAVSLPDFLVFDVDLNERNRRHCLFMTVLGCQGLSQDTERDAALADLLKVCPDHPVRQLL